MLQSYEVLEYSLMVGSQTPAHAGDYTRKTIAAAFGLSVEELFDEVEAKPLASGSIGQVGLGRVT